jgi:hypothetical protein
MRQLFAEWIDHTSQLKLFGINLLFNAGITFAELVKSMPTVWGYAVGVITITAVQLGKWYRDHRSWQAEERRKNDIHRRFMDNNQNQNSPA